MQVTINIPENLPETVIQQQIIEFEGNPGDTILN
jgi:hypothetical protein